MAGGIKTGKGGFEIDGKVYDFDPGDPTAAGDDFGTPDHGDINVDNSQKDLSKKTRTTLAKYLSDVTLGKEGSSPVANAYPVAPPPPGPTSVVMTSLSDTHGVPSPIPGGKANDPQFAEPKDTRGVVVDSPDLRDTKKQPVAPVDPATKLPGKLSKGKQFPQHDDGNKVLSSVKKSSDVSGLPEPVKTYTQTELSNNTPITDAAKKTSLDATKDTSTHALAGRTGNNTFPINAASINPSSLTDKGGEIPGTGVPHPLSDDPINNPQFAKRPDVSGVTVGPLGDPASTLGDLTKGKKSPKKTDGNALLPGVKKDDPGKVITGYTSAVLQNNRFSDASRAAAEVTGNGNDAKPPGGFNPTLHHPRYGDVTMNRLAQVGTALSLRASQELNAASANNNPTSGGQEAAALLPGFNQLGASRIDAVVLEARDVLESLTSSEVPGGDFTALGDLSWGSLNNVDDPYSGILALGMIALSIALTAAITLLFEGLGFLLALIKGSSTGAARNISGRYVLGRHTVTKQADPSAFPPGFPPDIGALLGIRATTFPLGSALKKGTAAFFGIDDSGGFGSALISGLNSAASAPGFNSIVSRTIIRSSLAVIDAFKKAFSSPNLVAGIKNILNIIDVIRESKLIAAINVFALLGDQILTVPDNKPIDAIPEEPKKNSFIDAQPDGLHGEAVRKNRLEKTLKLAWASNRAPSLYLIPDSILTMAAADQKLGAFKGAAGLTDERARTNFKVQSASDAQKNGARISRNDDSGTDPNTVKAFEATLDAEYVPFSFHDLRTNEIISFHAFLAAMTDDYTASYETTDAYGRVDPIKVYKSTQRRIGLSFYIIATSEHDFDDMWMKINKLVTLVYPQYTRGHMLINDKAGLQFVQPFSQLIGASPLIRVRLGDLFRSNYSRFALARLFGLGGPDTIKLGPSATIPAFSGGADKLDDFKKKVANLAIDGDKTAAFTLSSDGWSKKADGGLSLPLPIGGGSDSPDQADTLRIDLLDAPYVNLMIDKLNGDVADVVVSLLEASDITDQYGIPPTRASEIAATIDKKYNNKDNIKYKIKGSSPYTVPVRLLKPTPKTLKDLYNKTFASEQANIATISAFLDIKDNALVRSFNSVQGKGLAGVIETMNFDWYDKVLWETSPDSVAPKMCKVTIAFAPIHDISPGIDHMGYNRAPIYPVGSAMRNGSDPEKSGG